MIDSILGRFIAAIMLFIGILVVPLILVTQKQERLSQSAIRSAIVSFVDNARGTGRISPEEYESMYSEVLKYCDNAIVTLKHSSRVEGYNEGDVITYYVDFNNTEILNVIYESDPNKNIDYNLRPGDFLECTVKNENKTKAQNILGIIFPNLGTTSIYANYSGTVGNYSEVR